VEKEAGSRPDLAPVVEMLKAGQCSEALAVAVGYVQPKADDDLAEYLTALAYWCSGDSPKGAAHLHRAWRMRKTMRKDIRATARTWLKDTLATAPADELSSSLVLVVRQLAEISGKSGYRPEVGAILSRAALHLVSRGESVQALALTETMKVLGAGPEEILVPKAAALIRLGRIDELKQALQEAEPSLAHRGAELYEQLGLQASKDYRADAADWMFTQSLRLDPSRRHLHLKLCTARLKLKQPESAQEACSSYLTSSTPDGRIEDLLTVVRVYRQFDQFATARSLLESALAKTPDAFPLVAELALEDGMSPEDRTALFHGYLRTQNYQIAAVRQVGDTLMSWQRFLEGIDLFAALDGKVDDVAALAYYRGAFYFLAGAHTAPQTSDFAKAKTWFESAVRTSPASAMLADIVAFLLKHNGRSLALSLASWAVSSQPGNGDHALLLASLQHETDRTQALETLDRWIKTGPSAVHALAAADWLLERKEFGRSLTLARWSMTRADTRVEKARWALVEARSYAGLGDRSAALEVARKAVAEGKDLSEVFRFAAELALEWRDASLACLLLEGSGNSAAGVPGDTAGNSGRLGLVCGSPNQEWVQAEVRRRQDAGESLEVLMQDAVQADSARTLARAMMAGKAKVPFQTWTSLLLTLARARACDAAAEVGALAAASGEGATVRAVRSLARELVALSCPEGARGLLEAIWQKDPSGVPEDIGLFLANVLMMQRADSDAMKVIRVLERRKGVSADTLAGCAGLLIDAGHPGLAKDLLLDALRDPRHARGGLSAPSTDPLDPSSAPEEEQKATAALVADLMGNPDSITGATVLMAQLAYAWTLEDGNWRKLTEEVRKRVSPWHGDGLWADVLIAAGRGEEALVLARKAFEDNPREIRNLRRLMKVRALLLLSGKGVLAEHRDAVRQDSQRFADAVERDRFSLFTLLKLSLAFGWFDVALELYRGPASGLRLDAEMAVVLGQAALSAGDTAEGVAYFDVAASKDKCKPELLTALLSDLERTGQIPAFRSSMETCVARHRKNPEVALLFYERYGLPPGADSVERWLGPLVHGDGLLEGRLIRTLLKSGDTALARKLVDRMVTDEDISIVAAGLELGFEEAAIRRDIQRMKHLAALATGKGRSAEVVREVSSILSSHGLVEESTKVMEQSADDQTNRLLLGNYRLYAGQLAKGEADVRAVLRELAVTNAAPVVPDRLYPLLELELNAIRDLGLDSLHHDVLADLVKHFPSDLRLRLRLAHSLLDQGDLGQSVALWWSALDPAPAAAELAEEERFVARLISQGKGEDAWRTVDIETDLRPHVAHLRKGLLLAIATSNDAVVQRLALGILSRQDLPQEQLVQLGSILAARGRHELAERILTQALTQGWGKRETVLAAFEPLVGVYRALDARERLANTTRLVLLRASAADTEFRKGVAQVLADNEFLDEARRQYQYLALVDAEDLDPSYFLMHIALFQGDPLAARRHALQVAIAGRTVLGGLLVVANAARQRLQFDLARFLYGEALSLDPTNLPLGIVAAEAALLSGAWTQAGKWYRRLRSSFPGDYVRQARETLLAYRHVGLAGLLPTGAADWGDRLDEVLADLELEREEQAMQTLGRILVSTHEAHMARRLHRKVLVRFSRLSMSTLSTLSKRFCSNNDFFEGCGFVGGVMALRKGDVPQAMQLFQQELRGNPQGMHYILGAYEALLRAGYPERAREFSRHLSREYPRKTILAEEHRIKLSMLQDEQLPNDRRQEVARLGVESAQAQMQLNPWDFWAITHLSEFHLLGNNPAEARTVYDTQLIQQPWLGGLYNNLAYLLSNLNLEIQRGLELVRVSLRLEPGHSAFYLDTLGWLQYRQGDLAAAQKNIQSSLARSNLDYGASLSESLYHLATVQHDLGRKEDAAVTARLAAYLDPTGSYGRKSSELLKKMGLSLVIEEVPSGP
jgi:tetratricopeptide (TPR) repeat protein